MIDAVWAKATLEEGFESFRVDCCGAAIHRADYGETGVRMGDRPHQAGRARMD
jgi:hypothetical protein